MLLQKFRSAMTGAGVKDRKLCCFRAQNGCVRAQLVDLNQKKCGFYAKMGDNPLRIKKIAVPLHRRKETSRHLQ